jgi:L-lactate dehydrogenase complex protein LldG
VTTARDEMLAAVRSARPPGVSAPDVSATVRAFAPPAGNEAIEFVVAARAAGAVVLEIPRAGVAKAVGELASVTTRSLSAIPDVAGTVIRPSEPSMLRDLDLFVCEGELGVAENGAVWITAPRSEHRAALFLSQQVVIVLDRGAIVPDLHAAYSRLSVGSVPFGVFVAGPSKTADIEQALVIGAQGPKALTILLVQ